MVQETWELQKYVTKDSGIIIKKKQEGCSTMPAKSYREDLLKRLLDSNYASQYLKVAFDETLQDGNMEAFLLALKNIVDAKCSVQEVANEAQVSRQNLHLLLSGKENKSIETIVSVLHAVGLTIDFKPNPE